MSSNNFYNFERGSIQGYSKGPLAYVNNIGLMYPSDAWYAAGKIYSDEIIYENNNVVSYSWIYSGYEEYTISVISDQPGGVYPRAMCLQPYENRYMEDEYIAINPISIRPTFYLKSNVLYESGNGTQENPFRISIN